MTSSIDLPLSLNPVYQPEVKEKRFKRIEIPCEIFGSLDESEIVTLEVWYFLEGYSLSAEVVAPKLSFVPSCLTTDILEALHSEFSSRNVNLTII